MALFKHGNIKECRPATSSTVACWSRKLRRNHF